jgi:predicted ATPase
MSITWAYRDNEVNSSHPLIHKLDAIRKAGASVQEIVLAPLRREDHSGTAPAMARRLSPPTRYEMRATIT